jgi:hypothetical protein
MFRLSIAGMLWLVILAALNFAVLRYFEYIDHGPDAIVLLVGLMPLFDVFLISCYAAVTKHFRFTLMRREGRGGFAGTLALATGVLLALCTFVCVVAPQHISNLIEIAVEPFTKWFEAWRKVGNGESLIGATLCLIMSGPLLVIATGFSLAMSRYRLVITRRLQDSGG